MAQNIVEKVLGEHLISGTLAPAEPISYRMDQVLLQDATGTMAWMEFEQLGKDRVEVPLVVQYVDHNMIQLDFKNPDDHFFLQTCAARYGAVFSRPGNGISHYVHLERFDVPWQTIVGSDSHTTTAGAVGMFSLGIGGMDAAVVMAGFPFELGYPSIVPVREVAGTKVAQVCVGSSVNSGYDDLAIPAHIVKQGGGVNEWLDMTVSPGSRQILNSIVQTGVLSDYVAAGARLLEPACGPCVGMGQAPPSGQPSVRTMNRNCQGRSGTIDDYVYLASPATAAATAVEGTIPAPSDLGVEPPAVEEPKPVTDDAMLIQPLPPGEAEKIEIWRGPNIKPPPVPPDVPESLAGRVLIVLPDNISTGSMSPDGVLVFQERSNIPAIAEYCFRKEDPEFVPRAKEWNGGFIVAGDNYGQGSSREHAALAPLQLGVRAVFAKGFHRIHRRNLINNAIVPVLIGDDVYGKGTLGDE